MSSEFTFGDNSFWLVNFSKKKFMNLVVCDVTEHQIIQTLTLSRLHAQLEQTRGIRLFTHTQLVDWSRQGEIRLFNHPLGRTGDPSVQCSAICADPWSDFMEWIHDEYSVVTHRRCFSCWNLVWIGIFGKTGASRDSSHRLWKRSERWANPRLSAGVSQISTLRKWKSFLDELVWNRPVDPIFCRLSDVLVKSTVRCTCTLFFSCLPVVHSCSDFSWTWTIHISSAISSLKSFCTLVFIIMRKQNLRMVVELWYDDDNDRKSPETCCETYSERQRWEDVARVPFQVRELPLLGGWEIRGTPAGRRVSICGDPSDGTEESGDHPNAESHTVRLAGDTDHGTKLETGAKSAEQKWVRSVEIDGGRTRRKPRIGDSRCCMPCYSQEWVTIRQSLKKRGRRGCAFFWCTKVFFGIQKSSLGYKMFFSEYKKIVLLTFSEVKGSHQYLVVLDNLEGQKQQGWGSTVGDPKSSHKSSRKQQHKEAAKTTESTNNRNISTTTKSTKQKQHSKRSSKSSKRSSNSSKRSSKSSKRSSKGSTNSSKTAQTTAKAAKRNTFCKSSTSNSKRCTNSTNSNDDSKRSKRDTRAQKAGTEGLIGVFSWNFGFSFWDTGSFYNNWLLTFCEVNGELINYKIVFDIL